MRAVKRKGNRSDGCCQCKRKMPDGKYKVFYGSTFTEAENKYRDTLQSWEETHKKKPRASAVTYKEAAEAYEAYITSPSKPVKRGTVASYRKHLNPTKIFFGDELMEDIDAQRVRDYLDHLSAEGKAKKNRPECKVGDKLCVFLLVQLYARYRKPGEDGSASEENASNRAKGADQRTTGADRGTPRRLRLLGGTI